MTYAAEGQQPASQDRVGRGAQTAFVQVDLPMPRFHPEGLVGVVFALLVGLAVALAVAGAVLLAVWSLAALIVLLPLSIMTWRFILRRRVRRLLEDRTGELQPLVRRAMGRSRVGSYAALRADELVKSLIARGDKGTVVRICPADDVRDVEPLTVPFEPLELNEANSGFLALESEGHDQTQMTGDPMWRRVKRNITLKGGWIVAAFFLFNIVIQAWTSYQQGSVTTPLLIWSAFFLVLLFGAGGSWRLARQWLAVPGGLLLREAGWIERTWRLRLFEPRHCALCVHKGGRQNWTVTLADGNKSYRLTATRREAHFLLRAWLSPLPPPAVEQLSDLV